MKPLDGAVEFAPLHAVLAKPGLDAGLDLEGRIRGGVGPGHVRAKAHDVLDLTVACDVSLHEDGVRKVLEGVTTIDEILTVAKREDAAVVAAG